MPSRRRTAESCAPQGGVLGQIRPFVEESARALEWRCHAESGRKPTGSSSLPHDQHSASSNRSSGPSGTPRRSRRVEMKLGVEGTAEALDQHDYAGVSSAEGEACHSDQMCADRSVDDGEHQAHDQSRCGWHRGSPTGSGSSIPIACSVNQARPSRLRGRRNRRAATRAETAH